MPIPRFTNLEVSAKTTSLLIQACEGSSVQNLPLTELCVMLPIAIIRLVFTARHDHSLNYGFISNVIGLDNHLEKKKFE